MRTAEGDVKALKDELMREKNELARLRAELEICLPASVVWCALISAVCFPLLGYYFAVYVPASPSMVLGLIVSLLGLLSSILLLSCHFCLCKPRRAHQ